MTAPAVFEQLLRDLEATFCYNSVRALEKRIWQEFSTYGDNQPQLTHAALYVIGSSCHDVALHLDALEPVDAALHDQIERAFLPALLGATKALIQGDTSTMPSALDRLARDTFRAIQLR